MKLTFPSPYPSTLFLPTFQLLSILYITQEKLKSRKQWLRRGTLLSTTCPNDLIRLSFFICLQWANLSLNQWMCGLHIFPGNGWSGLDTEAISQFYCFRRKDNGSVLYHCHLPATLYYCCPIQAEFFLECGGFYKNIPPFMLIIHFAMPPRLLNQHYPMGIFLKRLTEG